eukprot:maker-scaffold_78-snap-gene-0.7-mRNA-1 protein AED:0.01 eAED:0.01 QI:47/1/1/1/0.66/0.5/4/222/552
MVQRKVHILDYGAGNVRSVHNAIAYVSDQIEIIYIESPDQISMENVEYLVFPGVGHFSQVAMFLNKHQKYGNQFGVKLKEVIENGMKVFGICVGMQALFKSSDEVENPNSSEAQGLNLLDSTVKHFNSVFAEGVPSKTSVPHIGWNTVSSDKNLDSYGIVKGGRYYFVHSFCVPNVNSIQDNVLTTTEYGKVSYVSSITFKNLIATQFHPEKSGRLGLNIFAQFLNLSLKEPIEKLLLKTHQFGLSKRILVCLDVRRNDDNQLVVTKGVGYDVRDKAERKVRNLGIASELAKKYYDQGCDELAFLSIMSFKEGVLEDEPIQNLLREVSKNVFVPLSIGGGIRDYGTVTALQVAERFFRCGADKVCIGSDAVRSVQKWLDAGQVLDGTSSIEQISKPYGAQAVVISVDSKRRVIKVPPADESKLVRIVNKGTGEEEICEYVCTIKGGREETDLNVLDLVDGVTALGAGEIMLNCIDADGKNAGFDLSLIEKVKERAKIPVIASSGAGCPEHFVDLFKQTEVEAGLAAGMFHRDEYVVEDVKEALRKNRIQVRN